tara:strand:- start:1165 stop:1446 length:282 start_codon:yes stop_codon:yes gene_type:complete
MPSIEKLDIANIIEIQRIRKILVEHPDLLSLFELLIIVSNKRLNAEEDAEHKKLVIEDSAEFVVSSEEEDIEVILDSDSDSEDEFSSVCETNQ